MNNEEQKNRKQVVIYSIIISILCIIIEIYLLNEYPVWGCIIGVLCPMLLAFGWRGTLGILFIVFMYFALF